MSDESTCPVCNAPVETGAVLSDANEVACPACGQFRISGSSVAAIKKYSPGARKQFLVNAQKRARHDELPYIEDIS